MLWDDHSHKGGSGDLKSDVVMVAIVLIWDFIFMLLGLDMVLYIEGYVYILYVTLSRLIVLYSLCRVNRGTNMSVVYVLYNFIFCFHCMFGLSVWRSPTCGVHPHYATIRSIAAILGIAATFR